MQILDRQAALDIQNDTLTLLLCNQVHKHLSDKARASKITNCCKVISDKTKDSILHQACRSIIKGKNGCA